MFAGRILDRVGTKLGLAVSFAAWCLASMLHAGMATVLGFKLARFLLGLSESGAFPGVTKAAAEWFPRRERAGATARIREGRPSIMTSEKNIDAIRRRCWW